MKRVALSLLVLAAPLSAQNSTLQNGVDGAQYVPALAPLLAPRGTESELRDIVSRFTSGAGGPSNTPRNVVRAFRNSTAVGNPA
jgi:hypothetical protein